MEDQTTTPKQNNKVIVGTAVFAIIAILAFVLNNASPAENNTQNTNTPQQITTPTPGLVRETTLVGEEIADGTYEAKGEYTSPAGKETIDVKITIKDGLVETAEMTPNAVNPGSVKFQGIFKDNFKAQVVGKKISEIKLDKVSGSSLTPKGFNDAIQKIITQNS